MCEAVLSQLLPIERRMLHERAARRWRRARTTTSSRRRPSACTGRRPGLPGEAAEWSLRAARKARSLNAFAEAWGYYQRALEAGRPEGSDRTSWSWRSRPAGTARLAGDPTAASAILEAALAVHPVTGAARASALERLGCFLWEAGQTTKSVAAYSAAAEALEPQVTAVPRAGVGSAGEVGVHHGRVRRGDRAGRPGGRCRTRARDGRRPRRCPHHPRGGRRVPRATPSALDLLREGVRRARDVEDRAVLCRSYANLILAYEYTGLPNEACEAALEGLSLLPEYGLELAVGAALACNAANMLRPEGPVRAVRGGARRPPRRPGDPGAGPAPAPRTRRTAAGDGQSRRRPGQPRGRSRPARGGRAGRRRGAGAATAELLAQEGDRARLLPDRRRGAAPARRHPGPLLPHRTRRSSGCATRPTGSGPAARPRGRRSDRPARPARRRAGPGRTAEDDDDRPAAADYRTARNELARARGSATAEDWADAVRLWRAAVRPREEAYCLLRQAECHADAKQREKAAAAATAARTIAERLGAAPIVAEVDALLARDPALGGAGARTPGDEPALRADRARVRGPGAPGHRRDQPADRPQIVHQRSHGGGSCVPCPA